MTGHDLQLRPDAQQRPTPHTVTLALQSGLALTVAHRVDVSGTAIVIESPHGTGGFHPTWAPNCAAALRAGRSGTFRDPDFDQPASVTLHPAQLTLTIDGADAHLHVTDADRLALADAIDSVARANPEEVA